MEKLKIAVVGVGATGSVLAAALLSNDPEIALVHPRPHLEDTFREKGITVTGAIEYQIGVKRFFSKIEELKDFNPDIIFLSTKTFHLPDVLDDLETVFRPGLKIVSSQNGLGTEDLIAERFGADAAFRMSLNLGITLKGPGDVEVTFFNRPNHLGSLIPENKDLGLSLAELLSEGGLETEFVEDIKLFVWKKMIMKCTMASICAVTDKTIKEALEYPPTREIAEGCFKEILAVARAKGYGIGNDYLEQALGYLQKVGVHRDSMCIDIANKTPTEIDFLGGKVVEYGLETGIPTPHYVTMTNLVKTLEDS